MKLKLEGKTSLKKLKRKLKIPSFPKLTKLPTLREWWYKLGASVKKQILITFTTPDDTCNDRAFPTLYPYVKLTLNQNVPETLSQQICTGMSIPQKTLCRDANYKPLS